MNQSPDSDLELMVKFVEQTFSRTVEDKIMTIADRLRTEGYQQGKYEGMQTGIEQDRRTIAVNMLREGCDIDLIARVTGLEPMKIRELQVERQH